MLFISLEFRLQAASLLKQIPPEGGTPNEAISNLKPPESHLTDRGYSESVARRSPDE